MGVDDMFFISGISNGEKKLDYVQSIICSRCGAFGRMEVYMTYMCFSLFFIPIFKWNKRYFVKNTCCNSIFILDSEIGLKIKRGDNILISENDLQLATYSEPTVNKCSNCGYIGDENFQYCPKCGQKL